MKLESDNVGSGDAADVSSELLPSGMNKDNVNPSNPLNGGGVAENPSFPSDLENSAGKLNKGHQQFLKRAPGELRARSKAFKKSSANKSLEAKNVKATPEAKAGFKKGSKPPLQCDNEESNNRKHADLKEILAEENTGINQGNGEFGKGKKIPLQRDNKERNKAELVDLKEINAEGNTGKNHKEERHVEENNDITHGTRKMHQKQGRKNTSERSDGTSKSQIDRKNLGMKERRQQVEGKKEKLGGLIFMCNAKTKPDCFRYRVMGVSMPKKDIVLSVKRGLKLFLYDFDLKLMHGIYEASSSGGMRLEPNAFGGNFPIQVRFSIYKDCFPLSESMFKKAIKDNYYEKNKFRTELTVRQAQKLSQLFRPNVSQPLQAVAVPVHPSANKSVRDREQFRGVRDAGRHQGGEVLAVSSIDGRGHPLLSNEMDRLTVRPQRQELRCNLYMNEREYRTYGLQGERTSLSASQTRESALEPYITDQERQSLLRQQDAESRDADYRDSVAGRREVVVADPLFTTQREVLNNDFGGLHGVPATEASMPTATTGTYISAVETCINDRDPYYAYRYGASSGDTFVQPPGREKFPAASSYYADNRRDGQHPATDPLRRMEGDHLAQLYIKYAVGAPPSNFNQLSRYSEIQREPVPASVSSRYSFAGPSLSFR